ncbi:MAG: hypothetical protein K6F23_08760 [Solobacterium sp.]|nr:hypothetical protein [Solobacterium sp.]
MKNRLNTSAGFFRYFAVIIAAMVMVYGINTISKAIAHTEPASDNSLHISAQNSHSTILKTGTEQNDSSSKYDPLSGSDITSGNSEKLLSEMMTIPSGKYGTMFRIASDVEDYYGNRYAKAYLLSGDGLVGYYNKAVKFRNDGYSWLKGQVALENTDYNDRGMEYGYMKVVLMDTDGNILDSTQEINDKSDKKADVNFYIGDLEEFVIAVDCTDGRAGGGLMTLIANDFIAVK